MIASFPMYERAETRLPYARFWQAIRARLVGAFPDLPAGLAHSADLWDDWLSPDLFLSQTCGLPYRSRLHGRVRLVVTPDFALPGCPAGYYNSVFVMRPDDPRTRPEGWPGLTLALNGFDSQSGWGAPQNFMVSLGLAFSKTLVTGAHVNSVHAVAEGRADIAAIDAQTWRMILRWERPGPPLREILRTGPTPGTPYITALAGPPPEIAAAVEAALADLSPGDRGALDIAGFAYIPADDYLSVPMPPPPR